VQSLAVDQPEKTADDFHALSAKPAREQKTAGANDQTIAGFLVVAQFGWHSPEALGRAWFSPRFHARRRLRDVPPKLDSLKLGHYRFLNQA
jgi:hypothetical protein